jgi:hypothetical protein
MKRQAISIITTLSLIVTLAVVSVQGQDDGKLVADVPFSFIVGKVTLPAGEYLIKTTREGHLLVQSTDGQASATALTMRAQASAALDQGKLIFQRYENQYFLSQVWTPGHNVGRALLKSHAELEMAKSASERQTVSITAQQP